MKFHEVPSDENFDLLHLVSESGRWELGFLKMIFGVRLRIGRVGAFDVHADLCCGPEPWLRFLVLDHVLGRLLEVKEEELTGKMVRELFPLPTVKPLDQCPVWHELLKWP